MFNKAPITDDGPALKEQLIRGFMEHSEPHEKTVIYRDCFGIGIAIRIGIGFLEDRLRIPMPIPIPADPELWLFLRTVI